VLSFAQAFDYYQAAVYQRDVLASSVAALASRLGAVTVLDCACGTGLPGIDLRATGVSAECSDADPGMLGQFAVNAAERGVDDKAHLLAWRDLCLLGRQFDLVMCRGNSLVYAGSRDAPRPAAGTGVIADHLAAITAAVAPGGVPARRRAPCPGGVERHLPGGGLPGRAGPGVGAGAAGGRVPGMGAARHGQRDGAPVHPVLR
jgi:hypothetical protein